MSLSWIPLLLLQSVKGETQHAVGWNKLKFAKITFLMNLNNSFKNNYYKNLFMINNNLGILFGVALPRSVFAIVGEQLQNIFQNRR